MLETLPAATTQEDHLRILNHSRFSAKGLLITCIDLAFTVIGCIFISVILLTFTPVAQRWFGWIPLGLATYYVMNVFYISPWLTLRRIAKRPYVNLPIVYRINKTGLSGCLCLPGLEMEWEKAEVMRWDSLENIANIKGTLLITASKFHNSMIPKDAFANEADRAVFFEAATEWLLATYEVSQAEELFRPVKHTQLQILADTVGPDHKMVDHGL